MRARGVAAAIVVMLLGACEQRELAEHKRPVRVATVVAARTAAAPTGAAPDRLLRYHRLMGRQAASAAMVWCEAWQARDERALGGMSSASVLGLPRDELERCEVSGLDAASVQGDLASVPIGGDRRLKLRRVDRLWRVVALEK